MSKKVTIYTTATCPYCIKAKQFLTENNVEFENVDLTINPARAQEVIEKSGQTGVPVLEIEGEIIVGFDKEKISQALQ